MSQISLRSEGSTPTPPSFTPNSVINEFDDFINSYNGNSVSSKLGWTRIATKSFYQIAGTATNPGINNYSSIATSGLHLGNFIDQHDSTGSSAVGPFALGGGVFTSNWVVKLTALSAGGNTFRFSCGLADPVTLINITNSVGTDAFVDGVFFQYTNAVNSGNYTINCTKSSSTTTANTTTAANTNFVNLGISVNAGGTSATFSINGVSVGTVASNIPTANLTPFFMAYNLSGTTPDIQIDLWYMTNTLTTPR